MGVPDELQNEHSVHAVPASIWTGGRNARRVPSNKLADSDKGAATRRAIRAGTTTATTGTRRNTGTQHGHSGAGATTTQSLCGSTSENARKGFCSRETGISLSDTDGTNAREVAIPLDRPVLDSGSGKRDIYARYASWRNSTSKSERVSVETVFRTYATKPIPRRTRGGRKSRALITPAHVYFNVTLTSVPYRYILKFKKKKKGEDKSYH